jgi:hypothetical protein
MRAWLELLKERHPEVTWVTQDQLETALEDAAPEDSSESPESIAA